MPGASLKQPRAPQKVPQTITPGSSLMPALRLAVIALAFSAVTAIHPVDLDHRQADGRVSPVTATVVAPADSAWGGGYIPPKPEAVSPAL